MLRATSILLLVFGFFAVTAQAQDAPDQPRPTDPLPQPTEPVAIDFILVDDSRSGEPSQPRAIDLVLVTPPDDRTVVPVDPFSGVGKRPNASKHGLSAANQAPVALPDVFTTPEGVALTVTAPGHLANDFDLDGDAISWISYTLPANGTMSGTMTDGAFVYTPNAGFSGLEEITYTITDGNGGVASSKMLIYVGFVPPPEDDETPPECEIVSLVQGPPTVLTVQVQDGESGLSQIQVVKNTNASVIVPAFVSGSTDPVLVTATKLNQNKKAVVMLEVTDVAGNTTTCDPVLTTLTAEQPLDFELDGNYPNPFNPATNLRFSVPETVAARLVVYDAMGRQVATLVDEVVEAGQYEVVWNARDAVGRLLPSGIYLYRLEAGRFVQTRRMALLK